VVRRVYKWPGKGLSLQKLRSECDHRIEIGRFEYFGWEFRHTGIVVSRLAGGAGERYECGGGHGRQLWSAWWFSGCGVTNIPDSAMGTGAGLE